MTSSDNFRDPFVKVFRNARFGDDDADNGNVEDQGIAPAEVSGLTADQRTNVLQICSNTTNDIDTCRSRHPAQVQCVDKHVIRFNDCTLENACEPLVTVPEINRDRKRILETDARDLEESFGTFDPVWHQAKSDYPQSVASRFPEWRDIVSSQQMAVEYMKWPTTRERSTGEKIPLLLK